MAIALYNSVDGGYVNALTETTAFTIGAAGNNRMLWVAVNTRAGDTVTSVTYNGVALTQAAKVSDPSGGFNYLYYLLEASLPAAGTYNVVVTQSSGTFIITTIASYTGAKQAAPEATASTSTSGSALSVALTPTSDNSWIVAQGTVNSSGSLGTTNALIHNYQTGATFQSIGDTGVITPAASTTVGWNSGGSVMGMVAATMAPFVAGGSVVVPPWLLENQMDS